MSASPTFVFLIPASETFLIEAPEIAIEDKEPCLWFFRSSKRNPFRRVEHWVGDSIAGVSQPIAKISSAGMAYRWLKYLGHEGD